MFIGIVLGTIIVGATSSWPIAWLGLEVNLICFIQTIMRKPRMGRYGIVYFLCQRWGSLGALRGAMSNTTWLILVGLTLKIGLMPCHFWGPLVIKNLKPLIIFIFLTWQKVGPLLLLSTTLPGQVGKILIILNAIGGRLFIQFTTDAPLIMLFSGLTQRAWLISLIQQPRIIWIFFLIYTSILSSVLCRLQLKNKRWDFMLGLLNMGGLPPFSGFGAKVKALGRIETSFNLIPLLVRSVISLYGYLRLGITHTPTIRVRKKITAALFGGWLLIYPLP